MRKRLIAVLLGMALCLVPLRIVLAQDYTVTITVNGQPVTLNVSTAAGDLAVTSASTAVQVVAIAPVVPTAQPQSHSQPQAQAARYTAKRNANLRAGPGTSFAIAGGVQVGETVTVVGTNAAGDWYELSSGQWIAAFLVDRFAAAPAQQVTPPTATPQPTIPSVPTPTPTPVPQVQTQACDPSYPTICIPPNSPDLDCGDISARRFTVLPPDPHRFDGDRDGIGCES